MLRLEFVRGHYFIGDREIENISAEGQALTTGVPCAFCGDDSTAMLMIPDREAKKAYAIPACRCLTERMPETKEEEPAFLERIQALDLASMPFFRIEPGPVLRINATPATIKQNLENIAPTDGRIVDLGKVEHLSFDVKGHFISLFPSRREALMTYLNKEWMDEVAVHATLDYSDESKMLEQLTTKGEYSKWAEELLFWRLNNLARKKSANPISELLGALLGRGDEECDCPSCRSARKDKTS